MDKNKSERIEEVRALMLRALDGDHEVSHANADDAVYAALTLVAEFPNSPDVRDLVRDVAGFIEKADTWTRWYA